MGINNKTGTYEFGADLVRITALFLVFWLHYFLKTGFYSYEAKNIWSFLAVMFRPVANCCVPLFCILTGYLKSRKNWTAQYYISIIPIAVSWLAISILEQIFKYYYLHEEVSFGSWLWDYFSFSQVNYSWYIGMYTGLFFLSPILNHLWTSCCSRQHKGILATILAVTMLPPSLNSILSAFGLSANLIPAYFTPAYFTAYYFVGCWIRTYRPIIRRWIIAALVMMITAMLAVINILTRSYSAQYYTGYDAEWNNIIIALLAALIFIFLYHTDTKSVLADSVIYGYTAFKYTGLMYLLVGAVSTLAVYAVSFITGFCIHFLTSFFIKKTGFRI